MKEYFARLSSLERRFVVGVALIIFVLLNWIFVRPLFYDWANYQKRRAAAVEKLKKFEAAIAASEKYKPLVAKMEGEGMSVPVEDQTVNLMLTIQQQASASGVTIQNSARMPEKTNQFFVERVQSITLLAGESELVDFLYQLGAGNSLIRVRGLSLHPDPPRFKLAANATLVASYQKKLSPRPAAPAAAARPAAEKPKPAAAAKTGPTTAEKPGPARVPPPAPTAATGAPTNAASKSAQKEKPNPAAAPRARVRGADGADLNLPGGTAPAGAPAKSAPAMMPELPPE